MIACSLSPLAGRSEAPPSLASPGVGECAGVVRSGVADYASLIRPTFAGMITSGDDDHGLLRHGFVVYDALVAWLRFAANERHNWPARA